MGEVNSIWLVADGEGGLGFGSYPTKRKRELKEERKDE